MSTRTPRGRRGTAAVIVAFVGLVLCAAAAVEAIHLAAKGTTWGYTPTAVSDFLARTTLGSSTTLIVAIVLAGLGIVALLAGITPPRRRLVELGGDDREVATGVTRRSLRRTLAAAATDVDGITGAEAKVGRRRIKARAVTEMRQTDGLDDRVSTAVSARLADLSPRRARTVRVRLEKKES